MPARSGTGRILTETSVSIDVQELPGVTRKTGTFSTPVNRSQKRSQEKRQKKLKKMYKKGKEDG